MVMFVASVGSFAVVWSAHASVVRWHRSREAAWAKYDQRITLYHRAMAGCAEADEDIIRKCVAQGVEFPASEINEQLLRFILPNPRIALLLLEAGADAHVVDGDLLASTLTEGHYLLAIKLIEKGAGVKTIRGIYSPLQVCAIAGLHDDFQFIPRMLIAHGADPNDGSLMELACKEDADNPENLAFARLLLESGANPNAADSLGKTLLQLANDRKNKVFSELLVDHGAHN